MKEKRRAIEGPIHSPQHVSAPFLAWPEEQVDRIDDTLTVDTMGDEITQDKQKKPLKSTERVSLNIVDLDRIQKEIKLVQQRLREGKYETKQITV
jgi:hypothetical protein